MSRPTPRSASIAALGLAVLAGLAPPALASRAPTTFVAPRGLAPRLADDEIGTAEAVALRESSTPAPTIESLTDALADARVAFAVDGDAIAAHDALVDVWLAATRAPLGPPLETLLVDLALARAELLLEANEPALARAALERLLPTRGALEHLGRYDADRLRSAPVALLAAETRAIADARLRAMRARVEEDADDGAASLDALVAEALSSGSIGTVNALGERAIPALRRLVVEAPGRAITPTALDPLFVLDRVSSREAAELVLGLWDAGRAFRERALVLWQNKRILPHIWEQTGATYRCREPLWLDVYEALLRDARLARWVIGDVEHLTSRNAVTPAIGDAIATRIEQDDVDFAREILDRLETGVRVDGLATVYERGLAHADASVRRRCAAGLVRHERSEALLDHADDPDAEVRRHVAEALRARLVRVPSVNAAASVTVVPEIGDEERAILVELSRDPDVEVRRAAARAMVDQRAGFPVGQLRALADDPAWTVRAELVNASGLTAEAHAELLMTLVDDEDARVLRFLDEFLWGLDRPFLAPWLAPMRARLLHPRTPLEATHDASVAKRMYGALCESEPTLAEACRWATEAPGLDDDVLWAEIVRVMGRKGSEVALTLEAPTLARFVVELGRRAPEALRWLLDKTTADLPYSAFVRVVRDADAPRFVRLECAAAAASSGGATLADALVAALSEPSWTDPPPSERERSDLRRISARFPERERNALRLRFVRDGSIPDVLALELVGEYDPFLANGDALTDAVLERWFSLDGTAVLEPVQVALSHLGTRALDASDVDVFATLSAAARHPGYVRTAAHAMARREDPAFVDELGRCLRGEGVPSDVRTQAQFAAIDGLSRLGDDPRAIELLLAGTAWAETSHVREACFNALDVIRRRRAERDRWAAGTDDPLVALLAMLDDEDPAVRAEAILSLPAFDATMAIPRLIRLLEDPDERVRQAARTTLERLREVGVSEG